VTAGYISTNVCSQKAFTYIPCFWSYHLFSYLTLFIASSWMTFYNLARGNIYIIFVYMIDSDQRPDSSGHPLTSLWQITVWFQGILRSMDDLLVRVRAYIRRRFKKMRNSHRFENWKLIGCRLEAGRRSESYIYITYRWWIGILNLIVTKNLWWNVLIESQFYFHPSC